MAEPVAAGMPDGLSVSPTYTLRVTALDASDGSPVAGVVVGLVVLTGAVTGTGDGAGPAAGGWRLVPGPGA